MAQQPGQHLDAVLQAIQQQLQQQGQLLQQQVQQLQQQGQQLQQQGQANHQALLQQVQALQQQLQALQPQGQAAQPVADSIAIAMAANAHDTDRAYVAVPRALDGLIPVPPQWPQGFNRSALSVMGGANMRALLDFYGQPAPAGAHVRTVRNLLADVIGTRRF